MPTICYSGVQSPQQPDDEWLQKKSWHPRFSIFSTTSPCWKVQKHKILLVPCSREKYWLYCSVFESLRVHLGNNKCTSEIRWWHKSLGSRRLVHDIFQICKTDETFENTSPVQYWTQKKCSETIGTVLQRSFHRHVNVSIDRAEFICLHLLRLTIDDMLWDSIPLIKARVLHAMPVPIKQACVRSTKCADRAHIGFIDRYQVDFVSRSSK